MNFFMRLPGFPYVFILLLPLLACSQSSKFKNQSNQIFYATRSRTGQLKRTNLEANLQRPLEGQTDKRRTTKKSKISDKKLGRINALQDDFVNGIDSLFLDISEKQHRLTQISTLLDQMNKSVSKLEDSFLKSIRPKLWVLISCCNADSFFSHPLWTSCPMLWLQKEDVGELWKNLLACNLVKDVRNPEDFGSEFDRFVYFMFSQCVTETFPLSAPLNLNTVFAIITRLIDPIFEILLWMKPFSWATSHVAEDVAIGLAAINNISKTFIWQSDSLCVQFARLLRNKSEEKTIEPVRAIIKSATLQIEASFNRLGRTISGNGLSLGLKLYMYFLEVLGVTSVTFFELLNDRTLKQTMNELLLPSFRRMIFPKYGWNHSGALRTLPLLQKSILVKVLCELLSDMTADDEETLKLIPEDSFCNSPTENNSRILSQLLINIQNFYCQHYSLIIFAALDQVLNAQNISSADKIKGYLARFVDAISKDFSSSIIPFVSPFESSNSLSDFWSETFGQPLPFKFYENLRVAEEPTEHYTFAKQTISKWESKAFLIVGFSLVLEDANRWLWHISNDISACWKLFSSGMHVDDDQKSVYNSLMSVLTIRKLKPLIKEKIFGEEARLGLVLALGKALETFCKFLETLKFEIETDFPVIHRLQSLSSFSAQYSYLLKEHGAEVSPEVFNLMAISNAAEFLHLTDKADYSLVADCQFDSDIMHFDSISQF